MRAPSWRWVRPTARGPAPYEPSRSMDHLLKGRAPTRAGGHEGRDVEDQRDPSVAEDGCARDALDAAEVGLQALQDDLPLADQLVDEERHEPVGLGIDD